MTTYKVLCISFVVFIFLQINYFLFNSVNYGADQSAGMTFLVFIEMICTAIFFVHGERWLKR